MCVLATHRRCAASGSHPFDLPDVPVYDVVARALDEFEDALAVRDAWPVTAQLSLCRAPRFLTSKFGTHRVHAARGAARGAPDRVVVRVRPRRGGGGARRGGVVPIERCSPARGVSGARVAVESIHGPGADDDGEFVVVVSASVARAQHLIRRRSGRGPTGGDGRQTGKCRVLD